MSTECVAVLLAAGSGTRVGAAVNKVLLPLGGGTVLSKVLATFLKSGLFGQVVIVASQRDLAVVEEIVSDELNEARSDIPVSIVPGGSNRQESVASALDFLFTSEASSEDVLVLIHDAARCFVSRQLLLDCIEACRVSGSVSAALPVVDSLISTANGEVEVVNRDYLWSIQTPQVFFAPLIINAHLEAQVLGLSATDDAALVRRHRKVELIPGERGNFKITTADDYEFALSLGNRSG